VRAAPAFRAGHSAVIDRRYSSPEYGGEFSFAKTDITE